YDFLGLSYIPEPATGFANIFALPKGTCLLIDARGSRTLRFATIAPAESPDISRAAASRKAAALLSSAVSHQASADVPVAALLSGGIDSSLVVAAYARNTSRPIETFNVSFPDRAHDETHLAVATARQYNTRHHTVELDPSDTTPESVFGLLRHFDQPFADTSLVPTYAVSRAVRQRGIICTLTGDGGDEAFGGYSELARAERLFQLASAPEWLLDTAGNLARPVAGWTRNAGRQALKAVQLAKAGRSNAAAFLAGLSSYLSEQEKEDLVLPSARLGLQGIHRHFGNPWERVNDLEQLSRQMTLNYFDVSLPSDMLRKVDIMSMRAGIEVRVPMLDEDLVELALTLPHGMKTDGRQGKLVLRDLASTWLPPKVARHPKHGFTIPLDVMVQPRFHEALRDLLGAGDSRIGSFLERRLVRSWLDQFQLAGQRGTGGNISREGLYLRIFMLLALELWLRDQRLVW
ncbi:MAG TPA: asparagine synthase C-terminal domain-containing protein, partial [Gemmatimonadales bacterium]|nr:asparagine synthase C-terminal domain-containing protein [Gemmatimonadales bacterium]